MSFDVDRALLTREQRQRLEVFEQGFQSTFWEFIQERFSAHLDQNQRAYDAAAGEQQLGIIQGLRRSCAEVVELEGIIEREFQALVAEDEAPKPEGPEFDDAWH